MDKQVQTERMIGVNLMLTPTMIAEIDRARAESSEPSRNDWIRAAIRAALEKNKGE